MMRIHSVLHRKGNRDSDSSLRRSLVLGGVASDCERDVEAARPHRPALTRADEKSRNQRARIGLIHESGWSDKAWNCFAFD